MSQVEVVEKHKSFGGWQVKYSHQSKVLNCQMNFELFIPQGDEPTALVWFLAGLSSTEDNFTTKSGFQKYAAKHHLAFVMPDTSPRGDQVPEGDNWDIGTGAGFYINATEEPWSDHYHMYDYITKELPEVVYDLLPNFSGKEAIMGHSMGGYGALMIGIKNPDRYESISAFAPVTNPTQVPWGQKAFTTYLGDDESQWAEWDTVKLAKEAQDVPPILIYQGTGDGFYEVQLQPETFLEAAKDLDLTYNKHEDYDHNYFFISTFVEDHIDFHAKHLK